jgi:dTDP-4-dehydrorhamnose 3,5-epimerase
LHCPFPDSIVGQRRSGVNPRNISFPTVQPAEIVHFIALEDDTHFLYKTTDVYAKDAEGSIRWDDATLAIGWPDLGMGPLVAAKDAAAPPFDATHAR